MGLGGTPQAEKERLKKEKAKNFHASAQVRLPRVCTWACTACVGRGVAAEAVTRRCACHTCGCAGQEEEVSADNTYATVDGPRRDTWSAALWRLRVSLCFAALCAVGKRVVGCIVLMS